MGRRSFFQWDGHFNTRGYRLDADQLMPMVIDQIRAAPRGAQEPIKKKA